ncbi:MAG: hypothetical protein KBT21_00055 [Treponema sp.]|nr:hypothetical protein [Candidatus Treponema merdequi]
MSKAEKNINAETNFSAELLNEDELSLICGGTDDAQAVIDMLVSATKAKAINIDCCKKLQKFFICSMGAKCNFDKLVHEALTSKVISGDEYLCVINFYRKNRTNLV